jgi:hypothetical protein
LPAILAQYWPAIGAGVYLIYALGWQPAQIPTAVMGLFTALGIQSAKSAHAKIDKF